MKRRGGGGGAHLICDQSRFLSELKGNSQAVRLYPELPVDPELLLPLHHHFLFLAGQEVQGDPAHPVPPSVLASAAGITH